MKYLVHFEKVAKKHPKIHLQKGLKSCSLTKIKKTRK
jgi:hypothetical protein